MKFKYDRTIRGKNYEVDLNVLVRAHVEPQEDTKIPTLFCIYQTF